MSSETGLSIELSEIIIAAIFSLVVIGGITIVSSPDGVKTQLVNIETSAISSLVTPNTEINIEINEEFNLKETQESFIVEINNFESEVYIKDKPENIEFEKENSNLIIKYS